MEFRGGGEWEGGGERESVPVQGCSLTGGWLLSVEWFVARVRAGVQLG